MRKSPKKREQDWKSCSRLVKTSLARQSPAGLDKKAKTELGNPVRYKPLCAMCRSPRSNKLNRFNGVLLVNKRGAGTSHDLVHQIRSLLHQKAVGHAGTLDPLAKGLMVILLGRGTKLSHWLLSADKRYTLTVQFGLVTDTLDQDGRILKNEPVSLEKDKIEAALKNALGVLDLEVPLFSAKRVKGRKLYSYARKGDPVELPKKSMSFFDLKILKVSENQARLSISCAKGSYMRAWTHFVGRTLKTGACLMDLTRDGSHPFHLKDSVTFDELKTVFQSSNAVENEEQLKNLCPKSFLFMAEALPHYPSVALTRRDAENLQRGRLPSALIAWSLSRQAQVNQSGRPQIFQALQDRNLAALLEIRPYQKLKILKNFI